MYLLFLCYIIPYLHVPVDNIYSCVLFSARIPTIFKLNIFSLVFFILYMIELEIVNIRL